MLRRATLLVAAAFLGGPPAAGSESDPSAASHPELVAACRTLTAAENPYFGRGVLDALDAKSRASTGSALLELQLERAVARLRLGDLAQSMSELETLRTELLRRRELEGPRDELERIDELLARTHWSTALAALQLGEDANCLGASDPDACIVPLRPGARHRDGSWAARAARALREVLELRPGDPLAVWLLNLAAELAATTEPVDVPGPWRLSGLSSDDTSAGYPPDRWRNVAGQAFPGTLPHGGDLAGGAVLDDFDGDGLLDLLTSTWDPCVGGTALRNRGDGSFAEVSEAWRLDHQLGGLNLLHADYDNDGTLDLLVLRGAWLLGDGTIRNSLLRGTGRGDGFTFLDVTVDVGLALPARPTQAAAWADVDGDGDLDLYVGNEATASDPHASQLFLNPTRAPGTAREETSRFLDVAATAGVENFRFTKGVSFGDYDNDGDPDLYVSNFGLNRLYRNDTKTSDAGETVVRFVDVARELGVTRPELQSFATWWFDYDNDGDLDLFVADYRSQARAIAASYSARAERLGQASGEGGQPLLYRNLLVETGHVGFREVSREVGLWRPAMPMGANFADLDNDGWLDFVLGTGEPDLASILPNQAWRNLGGRFVEITAESGLGHLQKGHGIAFGDVDHDGDEDLLHQLGGFYPVDRFPNALFVNPTRSARVAPPAGVAEGPAPDLSRWVTLELEGKAANRSAIGARLRFELVTPEGPRTLFRTISSGGSFGSSSLRLTVGLGDATAIRRIVIRWPGSGTQILEADAEPSVVPLERFLRIREGEEPELLDRPSFVMPRPAPSVEHGAHAARNGR